MPLFLSPVRKPAQSPVRVCPLNHELIQEVYVTGSVSAKLYKGTTIDRQNPAINNSNKFLFIVPVHHFYAFLFDSLSEIYAPTSIAINIAM